MTPGQRWVTNSGEYAFIVENKAWRRIGDECKKSHDRETGGLLIGYYTGDESTAIVTEASGPPQDSKMGRSWFWRGVAGLRDLLARRWTQEQRTYYLGEWHHHPALYVEPSSDDLTQMRTISQDSNYHCLKPIMLIVGNESGEGRPVRAFVFPQSEAHEEFHRHSS